jgi:hypothetical protein
MVTYVQPALIVNNYILYLWVSYDFQNKYRLLLQIALTS